MSKASAKICWAFLTFVLVASCGKNERLGHGEDEWERLSGDAPIAFSSNVSDPRTRTSLYPTSDNFRVFAFYQPGSGGDPGAWQPLTWTSNFMYNQEVTYSGGSWTYSPVKYWPNNSENTLTFWAYAPYFGEYDEETNHVLRLRTGNSGSDYGNNTAGVPDVQFTTNAAASHDLMMSDLATNQSYRGGEPATGTVTLNFRHVMCLVDFNVYKVDPGDDYEMRLRSLSIEDIYFTAVYKQSIATPAWRNHSGTPGNITVYQTVEPSPDTLLDKTDPAEFPGPSKQVMPIPQSLLSSADNTPVLHVVYTFREAGSSAIPAVQESYFPLGRLQNEWEKGKHYTYNIHIAPGVPIRFTATVQQWDAPEQKGYFYVNE